MPSQAEWNHAHRVSEETGALFFSERKSDMLKHWKSDIQAVLDRDPAARSALEVILCYPSFKAVRRHRRAHWL